MKSKIGLLIVIGLIILNPIQSEGKSTSQILNTESIALSISSHLSVGGNRTVVVLDFVNAGGDVSELGNFISDELSADLSLKTKVIIDRDYLKDVMRKCNLCESDLLNNKTIKELGKISGADSLIVGTITKFGKNMRVSCKVIDVESSNIIHVERWDIKRNPQVDRLFGTILYEKEIKVKRVKKEDSNNNPLLRLLMQETEEENNYTIDIKVRPIRVISDCEATPGNYYATVVYTCIFTKPYDRSMFQNTVEISGRIRRAFLSTGYRMSGFRKLYRECEKK
jgi:TolB-like protein